MIITAEDEYTINKKRELFIKIGHAASLPKQRSDGIWQCCILEINVKNNAVMK